MSQVLDFTDAARPRRIRLRVVPRGDEMDGFWPDVSRGNAAEEEAVVNRANAPKHVLTEVLVLFAVVAVLVLAVTLFVPGPSF
ncbi:MAG TPA: hypothetical protein VNU97_12870 [Rhizomicrobium sp.]|jgi:hypothetical protein|nr:hypothetical protein [Rhizomicrobium sp.]